MRAKPEVPASCQVVTGNMSPHDDSTSHDDVVISSQSTIVHSETSSLLGKSLDEEARVHSYETVESDSERAPAEAHDFNDGRRFSNAFVARTVVALLIGKSNFNRPGKFNDLTPNIGAFTANADGSLVMATYPVIGSEFNDLENSSWLFIGFMLAGSATQSVVSSHQPRVQCSGY